ncbi:MAG: hypothetical protein O7D35_06565 [Acidobacteria bacterium]|nr:hypothetical protein [Acidobacteriota bacterium]
MNGPTQPSIQGGSTLRLGLVAVLLVLAGACGGADLLEPGRFEGNIFIHEGLGIRLEFPGDWVILPLEAQGDMSRGGRELLSGGDPTGGAYANAGAPTSRLLFQVNRYPLGTVQGMNPGLVGAVENISARPQIQTAVDYLQMLQSFLEQGGAPIVFEPIAPSTILGGQEFAILAVTLRPTADLIIGQVYYARRVDDGIFTIVATSANLQDWQIMEKILEGLVMAR